MTWFRRLFARAEPTLTWLVVFEEGGRAYTYRRTEQQFRLEMEERYMLHGEFPHRVQVVRHGKVVDVRIDTE